MAYRYQTLQAYGNANTGFSITASQKATQSRGQAVAWAIGKLGHWLFGIVERRQLQKDLEKMEKKEIARMMPEAGGVLVRVTWLTSQHPPHETRYNQAGAFTSGKDFVAAYKKYKTTSYMEGLWRGYTVKYSFLWVTKGGVEEK